MFPIPSLAPSPEPCRRAVRIAAALSLAALSCPPPAAAHVGFYAGRAGANVYNRSAQVVVARDGQRTVLSLMSDVQGDPGSFALVVPVPAAVTPEQVHVADRAVFERLDAWSAPRLVQTFDRNPCPRDEDYERAAPRSADSAAPSPAPRSEEARERDRMLGVTVEEAFTAGEYDFTVVSAEEASGLETWLRENGFRAPDGASRLLRPYLRSGMRFVAAKVNLREQAAEGIVRLRPIQIAYDAPRFALPVRLGTLNARGTQNLIVYVLSREGRADAANYRSVRVPSGAELPPNVQERFGRFYRAMFARLAEREGTPVFLEFAAEASWNEPGAPEPLSRDELRELGAMWLDDATAPAEGPDYPYWKRRTRPVRAGAYVTRLHLRFTRETLPEDPVFRLTSDRASFTARWTVRTPWAGRADCDAARRYRMDLEDRRDRECETLAVLTGWDLADIRAKAGLDGGRDTRLTALDRWWTRLWK